MKLIHLIEYSLEKEIKMRGHKLLPAIKNDTHFYEQVKDKDPEDQMQELYRRLEDMDPTPNFKFVPWIAKQYSDQKFRIEDSSRVSTVLSEFKKLQPHLKKYGHSADLNQYNFHSLEEMIDSIQSGDDSSDHQSNKLEGVDLDEVEVLYDGPYGLLVIPKTEEASCELGKGTKWCTAALHSDNMFNYYSKDGSLYIWIDKDGSKYQFHFETMQFMDDKDVPIDRDKLNYFRTEHPVLKKFFKEKEKENVDINGPAWAYKYAKYAIKGRWPEGEEVIKTDPEQAYWYAKEIIKGRWPEGEEVFKTDPDWAFKYAKEIIKGRWPEGEEVFKTDPDWAFKYAKEIIKGRWPEGEEIFKTDPDMALRYAKEVVGGRWPEGEDTIKTYIGSSIEYANDIIGGRWKKAEEMAKTDPEWAYYYALDVIKGPWPEGEEVINSDPDWAYYYARDVVDGQKEEG